MGERRAYGLRPQHKLLTSAQYSAVMDSRRSLRGEFFVLHYRLIEPRQDVEVDAAQADVALLPPHVTTRLGLIVAKRLAKRAVQRNLLKRLAREAFRQLRMSLPAADLVLRLAKPPGQILDTAARQAWRRDIDALLLRLARQLSPREP